MGKTYKDSRDYKESLISSNKKKLTKVEREVLRRKREEAFQDRMMDIGFS